MDQNYRIPIMHAEVREDRTHLFYLGKQQPAFG